MPPFPTAYVPDHPTGERIALDPRKHPDYPRPGCTEPACGWPDPCDACYDAAVAAELAGAGLPHDGHHEGDAPPVIGWSL